jgi:DNA polymerase-3 subunit alpha
MPLAEFVHLNVQSDYSLSEHGAKGASKVAQLVVTAKKMGFPALALTDRDSMYGALEFSAKAADGGLQPLIGAKLAVRMEGEIRGYVNVIAQNETGYANLLHILNSSHRPPSEDAPAPARPGFEVTLLESHFDGLIVLTGGEDDGILYKILQDRNLPKEFAFQLFEYLSYWLGDRLYIEVNRNGPQTEAEATVEDTLLDIAFNAPPIACADGIVRRGAPIVATSTVLYATPDRHDAYEIVSAVSEKRTILIKDGEIVTPSPKRFYMRSQAEMEELFADLPEGLANTLVIARRCAFRPEGRKPLLPNFPTEDGRTEGDELRHQAREGLEQRFVELGIADEEQGAYRERLEYELDVIDRMGFPGYFLIVADFIAFALREDIPVGPGRGSGAGSLVAYSLRITDLDPLRFGLIFERFLNPERVSMPDFDIDFCETRREEMFTYVSKKYGADCVARIATFGEVKSKTALKDAGRIITSDEFGGFGFGELNEISQLIPKSETSPDPMKLKEAYEKVPEFRERVDTQDKMKVLYDLSCKIEGLYRSQGSHAAGVIIGGRPLQTLVPVGWDANARSAISQFNLKFAEMAGLVKFDFLGLKTLSVIKETLDLIRETRGIDINLATIPLDDPEVYELFAKGMTNGVFQFESEGMKNVLIGMKPDRIEDLIAANALYRPGPMEQIPLYSARKNGQEPTEYPEPVDGTKPFLEETYGILVYQEQVQKIAQVVAGYTLGGADLLRRAMGKKIKEEMDRERARFVQGAVDRGYKPDAAEKLFDHVAAFAGYGFNKSHSAAYAVIAYRTGYLKTKYPVEFFSALLSFESEPERMALIKDDLDAFEIPLLPPDINRSKARFRPEADPNSRFEYSVRFGLNAIKQISGDLRELELARGEEPFRSLADFYDRAGHVFNSGQIGKLVEAGSFDNISTNRHSTYQSLTWLSKKDRKKDNGTLDLFGGMAKKDVPKEVSDVQEWGNRIDREFDAVGFWFHHHPLDPYLPRLQKTIVRRRKSIVDHMRSKGMAEFPGRKVCGMVEKCLTKESKRGHTYLEILLSEKKDSYWVKFFPRGDDGEIERLRHVLNGSMAGRVPVVVTGDFVLDEGRGATIWGKNVVDANAFLEEIARNMLIILDPRHCVLPPEEERFLQKKKTEEDQGTTPAGTTAQIRSQMQANATKALGDNIREYLLQFRTTGEDPMGSEIHIRYGVGNKGRQFHMKEKIRLRDATIAHLSSLPGVASVSELKEAVPSDPLPDTSRPPDTETGPAPRTAPSVPPRPRAGPAVPVRPVRPPNVPGFAR